jgi:hypothetical protein
MLFWLCVKVPCGWPTQPWTGDTRLYMFCAGAEAAVIIVWEAHRASWSSGWHSFLVFGGGGVLSSNLDLETDYPDIFMGFFSPAW